MNAFTPRLYRSVIHLHLLLLLVQLALSLGRRRRLVFRHQEVIQIAPAALAREIGVISRRNQADRLGRPRIHITGGIDPLLNLVCTKSAFVIHNRVVRGFHVALQTCVRLQIKVKIKPRYKKNTRARVCEWASRGK